MIYSKQGGEDMERWEAIKSVQRMEDYIEEHLNSTITLKELAQAAGYSQWHAARMFKELTGKPPFEYIRELRLSRASLILRESQGMAKVADVA
jgi:AraC-like DNA-binding protein